VVIRRRYLDHVEAHEIDGTKPAQDHERLAAGKPARDRRAGTRRECRIERVDVEGEIGLPAPHPS
jgi:hypothetical protein